MDEREPRIDEDCRRRFEAHRLSGGADALGAFLPAAGTSSYADTLEELLLIELEFRWKAWDGEGDPPEADALLAEHPLLDTSAETRIRTEAASMRARFGRRRPVGEGARFGRYVLAERVGRGASADVWRARDEVLRRDVAVKLAREELVGDELVMARLLREARSTAQLRHPAIVTVHEVSTRDGQPFIVSDFIEGPTLAQELLTRSFPPDESAGIVARLADALDYAHACGVVHRDVKPGNVLMTAEGRPVLADFGLAQLARAEIGLTRQGDVLGTPAYMAPEQARGDVEHVDARTDVYALGAVLYELITGSRPFAGASAASVIYSVIHDVPQAPRRLRGDVPADLETICGKAMAREPGSRYATARELADDLRRFLAREPIAARPPGPLRKLFLFARRNPALATTLLVSAAVVLVVAAVAFERVVEERDLNRIERDRAQSNLYRALLGEAGARLAALDTGWYTRSREAVAEAARLDVERQDTAALRELAARCEGIARPSFTELADFPAHGGPVRALVEVPGRDLVAGIGAPDEVWLRSTRDGAVVATRRFHGDELRALAALADGEALIVGGDAGRVHLLELPGLDELAAVDVGAEAWCAATDGERVAVGLGDGRVRLFDAASPGALAPVAEHRLDEHGVLALAFSPDGARLASSHEGGVLAEWDPASFERLSFDDRVDAARTLRYAPSGGLLAFAAYETFGVGTLAPGRPPVEHGGLHEAAVRDLQFTADGRVVTGSSDGTVRAWTAGLGALAVAEPKSPSGAVTALAVLGHDGRIAAAHLDGRLRVWRLAESRARQYFNCTHTAVFVPHTARLFTGLDYFEFEAADDALRTRRSFRVSAAAEHDGQVWGAAVSSDGRLAASSGHAGAVRLSDAATGEWIADFVESGELAWAVAFSGDGSTLAAAIGAGVRLFDVPTRTERARLTGHDRLVTGLAFHPSEPLLVSVGLDSTLRVWDTERGAPVCSVEIPSPLHGVTFSPDGARMAVATADGLVRVWDDWAGGLAHHDSVLPRPSHTLTGHGSAAWAVAWSQDGALFASCDDRGRAILRDGATLDPLVTLRADVRRGRSLSFGLDGRLLAVGCYNGEGITWDLDLLRKRLAEVGVAW